jgi:uncharacterized protein YpmS
MAYNPQILGAIISYVKAKSIVEISKRAWRNLPWPVLWSLTVMMKLMMNSFHSAMPRMIEFHPKVRQSNQVTLCSSDLFSLGFRFVREIIDWLRRYEKEPEKISLVMRNASGIVKRGSLFELGSLRVKVRVCELT